MLNSEVLLPEDAPVRVTSAQLEELDYRKLYKAYSSRGRKSVTDPRVLFKVKRTAAKLTFCNSPGVHNSFLI